MVSLARTENQTLVTCGLDMRHQIITTMLGNMLACWTEGGLLYSVQFAMHGADGEDFDDSSIQTQTLATPHRLLQESMDQYFKTGHFDWELGTLDWAGITSFQRSVLEHCFRIASGKTRTYGELAIAVGSPRAARAVGGVMAGNRWPVLIPCHRVVGASGKLTGYSGGGGLDTKRSLLELELRASQKK